MLYPGIIDYQSDVVHVVGSKTSASLRLAVGGIVPENTVTTLEGVQEDSDCAVTVLDTSLAT